MKDPSNLKQLAFHQQQKRALEGENEDLQKEFKRVKEDNKTAGRFNQLVFTNATLQTNIYTASKPV